jgi:hypothetical protein
MPHLPTAVLVVAAIAAPARADSPSPAKASFKPIVPEVFTVKSILGINPSADRKRLGESGAWKDAFAHCRDQPPLRVSDPRYVTSKQKTATGTADVITLELDFQCGLGTPAPAGPKCKEGDACSPDGATCGADACKQATGFCNYLHCSSGHWVNIEIPPPASPATSPQH